MTRLIHPAAPTPRKLALMCVVCVALGSRAERADAQASAQKAAVPPAPTSMAPAGPAMPTIQGDELDRVVAIVNGDVVLDSDVDEERRLTAFQPYRDRTADFSREKAIERLINRDLILQQARLQPEDPISDAEVAKELDALRKTIPECKQYACETNAGWQRFLQAHGFTPAELTARWRSRMEVLRFIEQRFRMGIHIPAADIKSYYEKTLLPEYERQHAAAPKLDTISPKIEQVLLQQQVSNLLGDWLNSLRAQGSVTVLKVGEVAP